MGPTLLGWWLQYYARSTSFWSGKTLTISVTWPGFLNKAELHSSLYPSEALLSDLFSVCVRLKLTKTHQLILIKCFYPSYIHNHSRRGRKHLGMAEVKPSHDTSVCWCTVGLFFACQSAWMLSSRWFFAQEMHVSIYSVAVEVHWPAEQQMYFLCWQTREPCLWSDCAFV